jgi:two-component system phosphate regulon sensor histidine kinase PhoR
MFWRLFATFSLLHLLAVGLLGVVIVNRTEGHFHRQLEESLHTKAILVREVVRNVPVAERASLQERMVTLRGEIATRITLIGADGEVLADSEENPEKMENHAGRPEVRAAGVSGFGTATRHSSTVNQSMMYVALRADAGDIAFVRVALPLVRVDEQLAELRRIVWTAAIITGFAVLGLAFWLTRRIVRPVHELMVGAERIASGSFGHKVYAMGHDELGQLAQTFNYMSERLVAQFGQLAEDREQLSMILSGMVEGVVAIDAQQRILFANKRAAELLDFETFSAVDHKLWEVVRQRSLQDIVRRALASPEPCHEELNWNSPATKSLTVHAARMPGSPLRGAVLVLHDTTELRRLERLRQEFVANVSHELKTPLSVIKACVETLQDGAIDDLEHRGPFVQKIAEQGERLHALILDLLTLARIESGAELFEFQALPLVPVVANCVERHRARAEAKDLVLEESADSDGSTGNGPIAWADEEAVHQILDNLVDNAIKYSPAGGHIWVRCREEGEQVCLEVEDTGIGIPPQDLPRIFERFYRVDKARSRELGGTGLGLSIVKHLVQALHGTIGASSRPGHGSRFVVRLPRSGVSSSSPVLHEIHTIGE